MESKFMVAMIVILLGGNNYYVICEEVGEQYGVDPFIILAMID